MYNPETDMDRSKLCHVSTDESPEGIIKKSIRNILVALGDDPDREGLKETPDRVWRMYNEIYEGMKYSNA